MSRSTTRVCRLCCSSSSSTRCSALFSKEAIQRDLPGRLSNLLQLPVSDSDGLSSYLCRTCMSKFTTVESKLESFRSMAKAGYEKGRQESQVPISSFCGSNPPLASTAARKRTKDTSGLEASPHTARLGQLAKRFTVGTPGRRLTFPRRQNCEDTNNKNCTYTLVCIYMYVTVNVNNEWEKIM